jgi:hypothetical protein
MNAHIRDAHFRPGNFGPQPSRAGRWVIAAIILAGLLAVALVVSRARAAKAIDAPRYDTSPEVQAYAVSRRRELLRQIVAGARRGDFRTFNEYQLNTTQDGFEWVLENGQVSSQELEQIKFILEEVERERRRRKESNAN